MNDKPTGGIRLKRLLQSQCPPIRGGIWLDCYNNIYNEWIAGAITTRVDASCQFFVTEVSATDGDEPAAESRQAR